MSTLSDFVAPLPEGGERPLSDFAGQVVLVVNVASRCGFTPQYAELEALHREYGAQGFAILGFPCNQFGSQEPGDAAETAATCDAYGVSFPVFGKVDVNGQHAHPLFVWLTQSTPGFLGTRAVKWNFTKFLLGRDGEVVARFGSTTPPSQIAPRIEELLQQRYSRSADQPETRRDVADILSLSKARKDRARAEKEARAAENRAKFGRTKAEKLAEKAENERVARQADAHLRDPD